MFDYYLKLAVLSFRKNAGLTALMITLVSIGIAASMTAFAALHAMSGDPIPQKSAQIFKPQIDLFRPADLDASAPLSSQLPYDDSVALMQAHRGKRQAAMYAIRLDVTPPSGRSFSADGRATYSDFFSMFDVPFQSGAAWSHSEDENRSNVVVLSQELAARMFPEGDAVGKIVELRGQQYVVTGVLKRWSPIPRFYDLRLNPYDKTERFFIPFTTAISHQIESSDDFGNGCEASHSPDLTGWDAYRESHCFWTDIWVELPTPSDVRMYRTFLYNYAEDQRKSGRFNWPSRVGLPDIHEYLTANDVLPKETLIRNFMATAFFLVCLTNSAGLMLTKFSGRAAEISIQRALGASRRQVLLQSITETTLVGVIGGVLGVGLTAAGLANERSALAAVNQNTAVDALTRLDAGLVALTIGLAIVSTVCAGLYPAWRASKLPPALLLKAN